MNALIGTLLGGLCMAAAHAAVKTEKAEYRHDDLVCEGYLACDDAVQGKRPGVLVVHEWWGLNDYAKSRARQLAEMGYVALAADMYGGGKVVATPQEAGAHAGALRKDRPLLRARAAAALEALRKHPLVDPTRLAAIGYCFGGGTVLELARSGAELAGVVSFHGNLDTPNSADARNIKAKVLVLHGAADPHVSAESIAAFHKEMHDAGVDWQMISYGGAVHTFTNPAAGNDPSKGSAYSERADRSSWEAMKAFFVEIFRAKGG